MTMRVDAVHEGADRVLLFNDRMTMGLAFVLHHRNGRIYTQLETAVLSRAKGNNRMSKTFGRSIPCFIG
ncbi:hypothetical protein XcvCFBP7112P_19135 [Xanthomonas citri pv. vignicola]|nr:hypothetical protein XcvCFBP7112P_19135 [Xanthomonas citri pv. vignicola]